MMMHAKTGHGIGRKKTKKPNDKNKKQERVNQAIGIKHFRVCKQPPMAKSPHARPPCPRHYDTIRKALCKYCTLGISRPINQLLRRPVCDSKVEGYLILVGELGFKLSKEAGSLFLLIGLVGGGTGGAVTCLAASWSILGRG